MVAGHHLVALLVGLASGCPPPQLGLHAKVRIHDAGFASWTDNSFICVNMDWWPSTKCDYGWCPWGNASILNQNLTDSRFVKAIKALADAAGAKVHLRLGGSLADTITYKVNVAEKCPEFVVTNTTRLGYDLSGACMTMARWKQINDLCRVANCDVIFGINALRGRSLSICPDGTNCRFTSPTPSCCTTWSGHWDESNAADFFAYTASNLANFPLYAFEFGNELGGSNGIEAHLNASVYASDFLKFKMLTERYWPAPNTPRAVLADTAFDTTWTKDVISIVGETAIDIFTHHTYYLGAGVDPALSRKVMDPAALDKLEPLAKSVEQTLRMNAPSTQIWMGETGGAYNSGHPGVTDSFISGFWYLDSLGMLAKHSHQGYCRQTLIGGNYGLLDATSLVPNPDYYSAIAWQKLMGGKALNITKETSAKLRVYAHCTRGVSDGSVTFLFLNLENASSITLTSELPSEPSHREEYHFTSKALNSQEMYLNKKLLAPDQDGAIPALDPMIISDVKKSLVIAPQSYAFVVFRRAQVRACSRDAATVLL